MRSRSIFYYIYIDDIFQHCNDESDLDLAIASKKMLNNKSGDIIELGCCRVTDYGVCENYDDINLTIKFNTIKSV